MRKKVLEILGGVNPRFLLNPEVDFLEEGLIDSFEIMNLVAELEKTFQVEIDPELIIPSNFQNLESIVKMLEGII